MGLRGGASLTLRIATVMAGNRQQSRFLALVSNYSRLAELTEEAANSQDAGTLQYLKTLDSIESKLNQLQVAFQEFYTSMGLENVFKGALDMLTGFIGRLNDLPKIMGKVPVVALGLIVNVITTIKQAITSIVPTTYSALQSIKSEIQKLTGQDWKLVFKLQTDKDPKTFGKETSQEAQKGVDEQPLQAKQDKVRLRDTWNNREAGLEWVSQHPIATKVIGVAGQVTSALGSVLSAAFLANTKEKSSDKYENAKVKSGWAGLGGNVLGATLTGLATQGLPGAVAGLATGLVRSIPNIITLIDGYNKTISETLELYDEEIESSKNVALQSRATARSALSEAEKLEELEAARYSSNEAMREYLDYCNEFAENHPELIKGYDGEHNAIIDVGDAYAYAADKAREAAKAETDYKEKNNERAQFVAEQVQDIQSNLTTRRFSYGSRDFNKYISSPLAAAGVNAQSIENNLLFTKRSGDTIAIEDLTAFLQQTITDSTAAMQQAGLLANVIGADRLTADFWKGTTLETSIPNLYTRAKEAWDKQDYQVAAERMVEITQLILNSGTDMLNEAADFAEKDLQKSYAAQGVSDFIAADTTYSNRAKTQFQKNTTLQGLYDVYIEHYLTQASDDLAFMFDDAGNLLPEHHERYVQHLALVGQEGVAAILDIVANSTDAELNAISPVLQNINKYSSADAYIEALRQVGISNEDLLAAERQLYEDNADALQIATDEILQLADNKNVSPLSKDLFKTLTTDSNIGAAYLDAIQQDFSHAIDVDSLRASRQADLTLGIWEQIINSAFDEDTKQFVLDAFSSTDHYDRTAITNLIDTLQNDENYGELFAEGEGAELIAALQHLGDAAEVNYNTIVNEYANKAKTEAESLDKLIKSGFSGMDYGEAEAAANQLKAISDTDATADQLVRWDENLQQFVFTAEGIRIARESAFKQLDEQYNQDKEILEAQLNALQWASEEEFSPSHALDAATAEGQLQELWLQAKEDNPALTFEEWREEVFTQLTTDLAEYSRVNAWFKQYVDSQTGQAAWKAIDWDKLKLGNYNETAQDEAAESIRSFVEAIHGTQDILDIALDQFLSGDIAELYNTLRTAGNIQFDYSQAADLISNKFANTADKISEIFNTTFGTAISQELNDFAVSIGAEGFELEAPKVINSFEDAVASARAIYNAMKANNESISVSNYATAALLEGLQMQKDSVLGIIESSADLSYDNLADFANLLDLELDAFFDMETGRLLEGQNYIEQINGKYRLTNDAIQALLRDDNLSDAQQMEVVNAIKSRNQALLEADKKVTGGILDEVNALMDAKVGDKLDLTYIQNAFGDFGGQLVNGILTITEDTNILQLAADIRARMEASGQFLQSDIVALGEALDNLLKSYASLISGGIQGSLSQTDAANLKGFAKNSLGVDIDFTRTKNGLKLSTDQAGKLYQELKKVGGITAQLVFDDLVESLSEAGSGFENISQTMARIAETQRQIAEAQGDTSGLQEQLALYQEIARAQSDNPDSFSFMDNSIPAGMQGPENYWNAVGTAFKVMNQAGQSGYMEIQDFYNITQEMKNLAIMSGNDLQFMGQTIYADGSGAAELIQMAMSALSNIDGEGVKVDFSKLGQSFSGGAADMASGFDDAVKTMAKAQIEMLDAEIAMLEAIVAMEELGDIDVDQNGILDPSEIFEDDGSYTGDWTKIIDRIRDNFENSETLAPLLENLEISGIKLGDLLDSSNQKWREVGISAEQYSSIMTALYKAAMSGDYDLDAIISSVQDVLSGTGQIFSYKDESGKQIIIDTSGRTYQFNWTSDTTKKRVAEALGKSKASEADIKAAQEAMDRYTSGQELSVEQNAVVQVILGNVKVVKEDGKPTEYSVDGEKYPTMNDALAAVALRNEGYKVKDITVEEGTATITDKFAGIEVTITANADGTLTYTAEGLGSFSSKEEALTAIYESQVPEEKREIETFEDWKVLTNITTQQGVKITNPKQFAQTSDETKSELIEQLKLGNYDSAEEILAVKCGVRVQLTNEEGELNLDNLQKVEEMFNLEDKTINLTVNLSEGTDPVLAELLNAGETPIPRTMEVDVSATGEFTANFVDSLNNLNAENLEIVVTKLAALSSSTRTLQQADFSNIDGLKTQWEAVLTVVQEVSDLIASLTEKTFTVNVETSGVTTPTVPTPTNTGGQTTPIPTGGGGVVGIDASQITVPGPDIKEWTDAATAVSDASVTAASGLTNVATPLEKMPDVSGRIDSLVSAMQKIPTYAASRVAALASSMAAIQNKVVTHNHIVKVHFDVSSSGSVTPTISHGGDLILPEAKGNVALAGGSKRTLVGELGPELVVSRGHYYVVGQNGAEFVDLDKDAIVFNHLQTKKLLGSGRAGRGTAITNERNAVSWATGNTSGPAMASASEALALLKQIRAMWQSLLGASLKDLGGLAGRGGGGGGGGGGNTKFSPQIGTFERWYNLMRQIADLEQKITLEEAKRKNMRNGADYSRSLQKELTMLQTQLADQKELNYLQQDYLKHEIEDFNKTEFTKIFTFTQDGLMQLVDGPGRGLDVLSKLTATDENGRLIRKLDDTAANQLKYFDKIGFDYSAFSIDEETGKKLDPATEEEAAKIMEHFWDRLQYYLDNIDGLRDTIADGLVQEQELLTKIAEIQQEYIDNQIKVEQSLIKAIEDRQQAIIDGLTDEKDAIQEATQAYIDGLSDALQRERDMYQKNQTQQETLQLQRQLAILQRSGGSAADIKNLQDQISGRLQDRYFDAQQEQIDAVQAASDREIERLDYQIELMTEALEYQKENGLLWNEVYQMMDNWKPEQIIQFIKDNTAEFRSMSALQQDEKLKEESKNVTTFTQKRDADAAWAPYEAELAQQGYSAPKYNMDLAHSAFNSAYGDGDLASAKQAAMKNLKEQEEAASHRMQLEQNQKSGAFDIDNSNVIDDSDWQGKRVAFGKEQTLPLTLSDTAGGPIPFLKKPGGNMFEGRADSDYVTKDATNFRATAVLDEGTNSRWIEGKFTQNNKEYRGWFNAKAVAKRLNSKQLQAVRQKIEDLLKVKSVGFSTGGLDDFTGLAMLHGTKRRPEAVLNADQTAFLREDLLGKSRDSLMNIVRELQSLYSSTRATSMVAPAGDTYNFENVSLNFEPGTISNDYSARRAGEQVWDELLSMARKSGNVRVSRR